MELNEATALIENDFLRGRERPAVWADLGCGSGLFTRALAHYLSSGSKIYAVDRAHVPHFEDVGNDIQIMPVKADFETDPLPAPELDGILMANSLHYVADKYSFLMKCTEIFSVDTFLIVEYDTDVPLRPWVPYPLSFVSLTRLFRSAGFEKISKLRERRSVFGRDFMYAAWIQKTAAAPGERGR